MYIPLLISLASLFAAHTAALASAPFQEFLKQSTSEITIGGEALAIEIAATASTREKGLGGRTELKEGSGMLFIFDSSQIQYFWMKDTTIPLSIAFFDQDKVLIRFIDMDPSEDPNLATYSSEKKALYALEVPQGWFKKHRIEPGMKFSFRHR